MSYCINIFLIFLYLVLLNLWACSYNNPQREIIKVWKVNEIKIGIQDTQNPEDNPLLKNVEFVDDILYDFKADGTYKISKNKQTDSGKWQLSADNKVLLLFSDLNPSDNIEFSVEQFTDFNLVLSTHEKGSLEKIILIPQY